MGQNVRYYKKGLPFSERMSSRLNIFNQVGCIDPPKKVDIISIGIMSFARLFQNGDRHLGQTWDRLGTNKGKVSPVKSRYQQWMQRYFVVYVYCSFNRKVTSKALQERYFCSLLLTAKAWFIS